MTCLGSTFLVNFCGTCTDQLEHFNDYVFVMLVAHQNIINLGLINKQKRGKSHPSNGFKYTDRKLKLRVKMQLIKRNKKTIHSIQAYIYSFHAVLTEYQLLSHKFDDRTYYFRTNQAFEIGFKSTHDHIYPL